MTKMPLYTKFQNNYEFLFVYLGMEYPCCIFRFPRVDQNKIFHRWTRVGWCKNEIWSEFLQHMLLCTDPRYSTMTNLRPLINTD